MILLFTPAIAALVIIFVVSARDHFVGGAQ
jgi:hypothetical protein